MNYSWTKTSVQEQFAWNLSFCLTKIWISPTLQVGWSGRPKHQLMLDFIFPPNLSELPFLVIPMRKTSPIYKNLLKPSQNSMGQSRSKLQNVELSPFFTPMSPSSLNCGSMIQTGIVTKKDLLLLLPCSLLSSAPIVLQNI